MRLSSLLLAAALSPAFAADVYTLGPDSERKPDVPRGAVSKHSFDTSRIFPGTARDYWVYVPAEYNAAKPACVMIFFDGGGFAAETGAWRVPIVFDNLIAEKSIPVTIAIMVNPGVMPALSPAQQNRYNRSFEYDSVGDRNARFLVEELIPEVAKTYNLSSNPDDRAVAGSSSGGIAAFAAAWSRPDAFHRVMSFIGSFVNLKNGDVYPGLVRKMEPLPLRVFQQDGTADQNIYGGNWFMSNESLHSALDYAGYESKFVTGTEAHNSKQGGAIFPDALRWLWRDYPKPVTRATASKYTRHYITMFLDPESDWEVVSAGHGATEGPAVDGKGNVFFTDMKTGKILKIDADKKVSVFKEDSGGAIGMMFGKDGRLYAAQNGRKRIVAYAPDGKETVLAQGVNSNDLAVTGKGGVYFTEPPTKTVWYIAPGGAKRAVNQGLNFPNGVRLSPDESLLLVSDYDSRTVWSYQIQPDGSLANGQPFYQLELPEADVLRSAADGMALDTEGQLYVATNIGIQICDQPGRVEGIMRKPGGDTPTNLVFGGPDMQTLYVTAGGKVYSRHLRRKGFLPWMPVKPPVPQL